MLPQNDSKLWIALFPASYRQQLASLPGVSGDEHSVSVGMPGQKPEIVIKFEEIVFEYFLGMWERFCTV